MGVLDTLRSGRSTGLYECRYCGNKPTGPVDECPHCGSGEIAHYDI